MKPRVLSSLASALAGAALAGPQLFRSTIAVFGDGITQLDQRDVFFLVPPHPFDGPIQ